MRTKNAKRITDAESTHMGAIKLLPCAVCGAPPQSEAHHIEQGLHFCTIPLCADCHRGAENGWHGRRVIWRVMKMDELKALNETIRRLAA